MLATTILALMVVDSRGVYVRLLLVILHVLPSLSNQCCDFFAVLGVTCGHGKTLQISRYHNIYLGRAFDNCE